MMGKSFDHIKGGSLFIFGMVLMLLGFLTMVLNSPFLNLLYASLGAILFGFYLIYDTQLIAGGKVHFVDEILARNARR